MIRRRWRRVAVITLMAGTLLPEGSTSVPPAISTAKGPVSDPPVCAIGARAIGVATGAYSTAELKEAGAHAVFTDLSETNAVLDAIFRD